MLPASPHYYKDCEDAAAKYVNGCDDAVDKEKCLRERYGIHLKPRGGADEMKCVISGYSAPFFCRGAGGRVTQTVHGQAICGAPSRLAKE